MKNYIFSVADEGYERVNTVKDLKYFIKKLLGLHQWIEISIYANEKELNDVAKWKQIDCVKIKTNPYDIVDNLNRQRCKFLILDKSGLLNFLLMLIY